MAGKTGTADEARERPLLESPTTTCRSSASCRRGSRALVILVVIDSPPAGGYTGGEVAAPIFQRIAEATLRRLGVPPTRQSARRRCSSAADGRPADAVSLPVIARQADDPPRRSATRPAPARRPRPVGPRGAARAGRGRRRPALSGGGVVVDQSPPPAAARPAQSACCRLAASAPARPTGSGARAHDARQLLNARRRSSPSISPRRSAPPVAPRSPASSSTRAASSPAACSSAMRGREGRRRRFAPQAIGAGRVRGGRRSAGAGRLDAAVARVADARWRWRRWRRVLRPPERRPAGRRHHRHQRQDDDQLSARRSSTAAASAAAASARSPTTSAATSATRRGRRRRRPTSSACCARWRPTAAAPARRGVVARAGAEARRPRALRRRRLHQPDPRSPRLPRRHGLVLRGQAAAVRAAAGRRDGGGQRRRSRGRELAGAADAPITFGIDAPADVDAGPLRPVARRR